MLKEEKRSSQGDTAENDYISDQTKNISQNNLKLTFLFHFSYYIFSYQPYFDPLTFLMILLCGFVSYTFHPSVMRFQGNFDCKMHVNI